MTWKSYFDFLIDTYLTYDDGPIQKAKTFNYLVFQIVLKVHCDSILVFQFFSDNRSTFLKMELFSKGCRILLRPPITFILFLNESPRSQRWSNFYYKVWDFLVFSKNRYSKNFSQISRSSCTHLPTERDMSYKLEKILILKS